MIPKEDKGLSPKEAFEAFSQLSQAPYTKWRAKRRKNPLKLVHRYSTGYCTLCKTDGKIIVSEKHRICKTCKKWCRKWVIKNHGVYKKQFMTDAIIAASEPVPCKFYSRCGNTLPRIKNGKWIRLAICDQCYPIWVDGVKAGRNNKVILRRY